MAGSRQKNAPRGVGELELELIQTRMARRRLAKRPVRFARSAQELDVLALLHETRQQSSLCGVGVSLSVNPLLAEALLRGARLNGTLLSGILMLADASLQGASLGGTLGLADDSPELKLELIQTQMAQTPRASLRGGSQSETLLLAYAFLRGVSLAENANNGAQKFLVRDSHLF
jgi:hypothetical protein